MNATPALGNQDAVWSLRGWWEWLWYGGRYAYRPGDASEEVIDELGLGPDLGPGGRPDDLWRPVLIGAGLGGGVVLLLWWLKP